MPNKRKTKGSKQAPPKGRPSDVFFSAPEVKTPLPTTFQPKAVTPLDRKKRVPPKPKPFSPHRNVETLNAAKKQGADMMRNPDGDTLIENSLEFLPLVGNVLSVDDVFESAIDKGITHPDTVVEASGILPAWSTGRNLVKNLKNVDRATHVANKLARNENALRILGGTTAMGAHLTDTVSDIANIFGEQLTLDNTVEPSEKKYLTGGFIGDRYMDNPSEVLMEDWRNKAKADLAGNNLGIAKTLGTLAPIVGSLAGQWSAGQQSKFANWVPNVGEKMAKNLEQGYQHQPLPEVETPETPSIPTSSVPKGDRLSKFDFLHVPAPAAREGWRPNFQDGTTETHLYGSVDFDDVSVAFPSIAQNPITKEFFEPTDPVAHSKAMGTDILGSPLSARSYASGEWKDFYDSDGSVLGTDVAKRNQRFKPQFETGGSVPPKDPGRSWLRRFIDEVNPFGTNVHPDSQDSLDRGKEFVKGLVKSPKYREMLGRYIPEEELDDEIDARYNNIQEGYQTGKMKKGTVAYYQDDFFDDVHFNRKELQDGSLSRYVVSHERGHQIDEAGARTPIQLQLDLINRTNTGFYGDYNSFAKDLLDKKPSNVIRSRRSGDLLYNGNDLYYAYAGSPVEATAKATEFRHLLKDKGIYDPYTEDFTEQHLMDILSDKNGVRSEKTNTDSFNRIFRSLDTDRNEDGSINYDGPKTKENFIWFMNNVVNNGNNKKGSDIAATGGKIGSRSVEVEGQELFELPNGEVGKFVGPSHENGGIDVTLPTGTNVYSKRIKGSDGRTMAKRKESRLNKEKKFNKKLENPADFLGKATATRMLQSLELEEQEDMAIMTEAFNKKNNAKMLTGGPIEDPEVEQALRMALQETGAAPMISNPDLLSSLGIYDDDKPLGEVSLNTANIVNSKKQWEPDPAPTMPDQPKKKPYSTGLTTGDFLGTFGNMLKANQAYSDTLSEISGSIPNVNSFSNFGKEGLNTLKNNGAILSQLYDLQTQALRGRTNASMAQSRGTARGVNQMRAMDLANVQAENQAQAQMDAGFAQQQIANNSAIAQQQNAIDQAVMQGDAAKRLADQQDYAQDMMNIQQGRLSVLDSLVSKPAEVLNKAQERKTIAGLVSALSENFEVDAYGNITGRPGEVELTTDQKINQAGLWREYQMAKRDGIDVSLKGGKLIKSDGTEYTPGEDDGYEVTNSSSILNVGRDFFQELGDSPLAIEPEITGPSKFYKGVDAEKATSLIRAAAIDKNLANVDLSTVDGVKKFQKKIGMSDKDADGLFGSATLKALEELKLDTTRKALNIKPSEYAELTSLNNTGLKYRDLQKHLSNVYGDVDEAMLNDKSTGILNEIKEERLVGAIQYADLNYDNDKELLDGLSKQEYRKALLIYPDLADILIEGQPIDLDMRVPNSTKTLGYLIRGSKYTGKRFVNKKQQTDE